jgi:ATP-dependent Lhr-like helicase
VLEADWSRRVVQVEPTEAAGVARWSGSGQPLSAAVARAIRDVLVGANPGGVILSERAAEALDAQRSEFRWAASDTTTLVVDDRGRARWWTFAGWRPTCG